MASEPTLKDWQDWHWENGSVESGRPIRAAEIADALRFAAAYAARLRAENAALSKALADSDFSWKLTANELNKRREQAEKERDELRVALKAAKCSAFAMDDETIERINDALRSSEKAP